MDRTDVLRSAIRPGSSAGDVVLGDGVHPGGAPQVAMGVLDIGAAEILGAVLDERELARRLVAGSDFGHIAGFKLKSIEIVKSFVFRYNKGCYQNGSCKKIHFGCNLFQQSNKIN